MKIKALVENTSISSAYKHQHGLSLYIESRKHKILFDLGSDGLFLENAKKMGVEIADVDTVVISHGHVDHAGALALFLQQNSNAKVYVRESAFDRHSTKFLGCYFNVGLDGRLKTHPQIVFTGRLVKIDEELTLFSEVQGKELCSTSNRALFAEKDGERKEDDFCHEQNLIITEGDRAALFAGCAHAGIVNIIARAQEIVEGKPLTVIGGFHLGNPISKQHEKRTHVEKIARHLNDGTTKYYTCHCTGGWAYRVLKEQLKERLNYLATGAELEI